MSGLAVLCGRNRPGGAPKPPVYLPVLLAGGVEGLLAAGSVKKISVQLVLRLLKSRQRLTLALGIDGRAYDLASIALGVLHFLAIAGIAIERRELLLSSGCSGAGGGFCFRCLANRWRIEACWKMRE